MRITEFPAFQHLNWHPDREELRRFAIAMLVGFSILGLISAFRTREIGTTAVTLWLIGAALAVASQLPGVGRLAYLGVYVPSSLLGYIISQVVLTVLFFVVFATTGSVLRLLGKNPLSLQPGKSQWTSHPDRTGPRSYNRQY